MFWRDKLCALNPAISYRMLVGGTAWCGETLCAIALQIITRKPEKYDGLKEATRSLSVHYVVDLLACLDSVRCTWERRRRYIRPSVVGCPDRCLRSITFSYNTLSISFCQPQEKLLTIAAASCTNTGTGYRCYPQFSSRNSRFHSNNICRRFDYRIGFPRILLAVESSSS